MGPAWRHGGSASAAAGKTIGCRAPALVRATTATTPVFDLSENRTIRERYSAMLSLHQLTARLGRNRFALLTKAKERLGSRRCVAGAASPLELPPDDGPRAAPEIEKAQRELAGLLEMKMPDKERVLEKWLQAIGALADPGSVHFWRALLGYVVPRDRLKPTRDELALSALALLVQTRQDAAALALLLETSRTAADPYTRGVSAQLAISAYPSTPDGEKAESDDEPEARPSREDDEPHEDDEEDAEFDDDGPAFQARPGLVRLAEFLGMTEGDEDDEPGDREPAFRSPPEVVDAVRQVALGRGFEARFLARRALE